MYLPGEGIPLVLLLDLLPLAEHQNRCPPLQMVPQVVPHAGLHAVQSSHRYQHGITVSVLLTPIAGASTTSINVDY